MLENSKKKKRACFLSVAMLSLLVTQTQHCACIRNPHAAIYKEMTA